MKMRRPVLPLLLVCGLVPTVAHAQDRGAAQNYPNRAIRIVVPYPPGGVTDIIGRLVAQKLNAAWERPVVVENRPGAGANLGSELVAKSAPDGYVLLLAGIANTVSPALYPKLPYDPLRDFAWITNIAKVPAIVVVHPSVPVHNARELIALAKTKPGTLTFGSSGIATIGHLAGELLKSMSHIDITHVPYKGSAFALTDTISGQIDLYFGTMAAPMPLVKAGRLRAIGVTSLQRASAAPDIPTLDEQGIKGFETTTWFGVAAPAGTPGEIIAKLHNEIVVRIIKLPEVRERLAAEGVNFVGDTPSEFTNFVKAEIVKWGKVVKRSGAKAE
jgi:tripartite-type tricarboxylate transporter receptor subunit TctC